jgi:hypothetical protein
LIIKVINLPSHNFLIISIAEIAVSADDDAILVFRLSNNPEASKESTPAALIDVTSNADIFLFSKNIFNL